MKMSKRKFWVILGCLLLIGAVGIVYFNSLNEILTICQGAASDEDLEDGPIRKSSNLAADKKKMWKLVKIKTKDDTGDVEYFVSPVSAINAAARVMESEKDKLIGMNLKQVLKELGHVESHRKGSYNFPFIPLGKDEKAYVFRFDCGAFGWQFDLLCDKDGKVVKVRRQWIH